MKVFKDRVSAYICLMEALIYCFNADSHKDSYEEAKKNVKEGCRIFREYGDEQEQQMCEIFHNAVVKNRDQNAWFDIIKNHDFTV